MKINLLCKSENKEKYEEMLKKGGFEVSPDGDLILYEANYRMEYLVAKDGDDYSLVDVNEVIFIESLTSDIWTHIKTGKVKIKERIYILESLLPPDLFVRISNSVIINRKMIKKIKTAMGMKFWLTMANGEEVTVTRSYYQKFKDYIGF